MKTIGRFVFDSSTATTLSADQNIPLPTATTSTNCISCDGSNITINKCGIYQITANFTFIATAAGANETQMYRNGNAVPGAHAISTAAAADDNLPQSFSTVITVPRNAPTATINFKAANATTLTVANVIVTKVS